MSKPEFQAEMTEGTYCCGVMEIGKFTKGYRDSMTYLDVLWGTSWAVEKKAPIAWHGVTKTKTQKSTEKALKKMGFKVKGTWLNDSGEELKFWLYVPKTKKKKARKK